MFIAVAVILFIAAEFVVGWWALPAVGFLLGIVGARRKLVGVQVALAAITAWGLLFAWVTMHGDLPQFVEALALSMKLAPGALVSVMTVLPALLAGPSAGLGSGLRNLLQPARPAASVPTAAGLGA